MRTERPSYLHSLVKSTERIGTLLVELPAATDRVQREQQIRSKVAWVDALYLWDSSGPTPQLEYPAASPSEDLQLLLSSGCMRGAQSLAVTGRHAEAGEAFLVCRDGPPPERLLASDLSARQFREAGRTDEAWRAASQVGPPLKLPLATGSARGLALRRLVSRRILAAEVLTELGRTDQAESLLVLTFEEITDLSGPDLEALLPTAERLHKVELSAGLDAVELDALVDRLKTARRRLAGFQEIRERLGRLEESQLAPTGPPLPGSTGRLHVVHDLYSDPGFILVWAPLGDSGQSAAVYLDAEELLGNLLLGEAETGDRRITILDGGGAPVLASEPLPEDAQALATVPLDWLFPHLRLAAITTGEQTMQRQVLRALTQLLPMGVALLLGVVGIAVQAAANRRERELFARQQDFIARVTHELKTPLAGIRVMAETLQMGASADPDTTRRFLGRIIHETDNLGQRIDEVLTAARQPEVSERTPVRPDELAKEVVELWRPRFAQTRATLEADLRPCAAIPADPPLLRDALGNLLDNALKYRKPGDRGRCLVRTAEAGRWVIIEVVDNGIGVPPAMRRRIFERFSRVEGPGRGKAGGHGLGLAFVAEAVAAHRGIVECTEGFDGGARFRIKLRRRR